MLKTIISIIVFYMLATANSFAGTFPPQGVYNSCEIDTALPMCENEDTLIRNTGFTWEVNYIGIMATKQTLQEWFQYDASIGLGQIISVKQAINDPQNVLTGTSLTYVTGDSNLAKSCGATNNAQLIACIAAVANGVPGFHWKWYIYDEPGCPNQSIGFCQGTLAGGNYQNVATLAQYIASVDPGHYIVGVNVGDTGGQSVTTTLDSWLMGPVTPGIGFDRYPIPENLFGSIDDIGTVAAQVYNTAKVTYPQEHIFFVGQAFSWYQEGGGGCTTIAVCPFPTQSQMLKERNEALWNAPLSMILWYYWPDATCLNEYPGCNEASNVAALKSAAFAP